MLQRRADLQSSANAAARSRSMTEWRAACCAVNSGNEVRRLCRSTYSALMPAALTIGYHFSTSALWKAAKAAGVNR
jgi:hypothetical protein